MEKGMICVYELILGDGLPCVERDMLIIDIDKENIIKMN